MDNEKYGIELELITAKFNEKIEGIKRRVQDLGNQKIDMAKLSNTDILKSKIRIAENEVENWKNQFDKVQANIERRLQWDTEFVSRIMRKATPEQKTEFFEKDIKLQEYFMELDRIANKSEEAQIKVNALKTKLSELSKIKPINSTTTMPIDNMGKGFDKLTSKIKRFGLSLLGIRTIWSLVSRASSAYLAQDTALANKLQSAWAGLGAMLAPIIERIVDLIAKAVKYINIFIKALTGVDLLARASAKSMAGTAKSAKALNKALAGFDELQNLDTDAGGGADIGGGLSGLNDVQINTEWADKIREFGIWFKDNWEYVLSGLIGTYTAIELISAGIGIVQSLGIGILIAGIVLAITSLIKYLKDPSWANFGKIIQGIGIALMGLAVIIGSVPLAVAGAIVLIVGTITKYWEEIKAFLQNGIDWLVSKTDWVRENFGILGEYIYKAFTNALQLVLNVFDNVFKAIKGIFDGIITFIKGVFTGNWKQAWEGVKQIFSSVWNGMKGIVSSVWNFINNLLLNIGGKAGEILSGAFRAVTNAVLSAVENILNKPIRAINKLTDVINKVPGINLGKLSTFSLPRLNVGTNYVPQDQVAMIHKGEAIIPKKFNSKEYFGGSNDETNARLEELIDAVRNIEINPYTTIKDVGKSALNYINNKSRQLGESVVV